jgi:hypothetical protein
MASTAPRPRWKIDPLFTRSGDLGAALDAVIACEGGASGTARFAALSPAETLQCYLSGLAWADSLSSAGI